MTAEREVDRGGLTLDLLDAGAALEVIELTDSEIGAGAVREPHRHDYHELLWVRSGSGKHILDGRTVEATPGSVMVIGRGQVHVFQRARGLTGAVLRFGDELLGDRVRGRGRPTWLLAGRGGRSVTVPHGEVVHLEAAIAVLAAEADRPPDSASSAIESHMLATILLWIERWYDDARIEVSEPQDAARQVHRRFAELLEADFDRHHDAGHYADALALPAPALSRALTDATGHGTKELIIERVMLEAGRLLRFSDVSVGEVAHEVGFRDPLYFSRAFKRHTGQAPVAYRQRTRGRA